MAVGNQSFVNYVMGKTTGFFYADSPTSQIAGFALLLIGIMIGYLLREKAEVI